MRCRWVMVAALFLATVLWRAPGPIRVPNGETRTVEVPPIGEAARLVFRVRADYWRPAGSNPLLRVLVDGRAVGLMRDRRTARLAGEPERDGLPRFDFGRWRVPQGPAGGDELALDVSDLVSPHAPFPIAFESAAPGSLGATPLVIEGVRLEAGAVAGGAAPPPPDWRTPRLALPAPPRFEVEAGRDRVLIGWQGQRAEVATRVTGGPHARSREVVQLADRVEVRDTIVNTGGGRAAFDVRHFVPTAAVWAHLGGRTDPDVAETYSPWNPTVFTPVGDAGLGLVAEDDVFRQQLHVDADESGTVGLGTRWLCLPPGEQETMVWSIYPIRTPSYWDFVNRVREDWKVNRTVEGSFVWFTPDAVLAMPADRLRDALARQRTAIASLYGGWVDPLRKEQPPFIGFGTAVLRDELADYRRRLGRAIERLKNARPGLQVLAYFDAQRDSSPDAARRFADSLLREHPPGRVERVDWNGRFSPAWGMVPTATNSFGTAMLDVARAMRALGADGLYWDEMDGVDFREPRVTFGAPDGRSCGVDDAGTPIPVGFTNLLSDAAKLGYAATGTILGNVPPTTRAFTERPDLRMVEAQGDHAPWGPMAHLTTPLAYVGDRGDFATARAKIDEGLLPVTSGFDVAHDLTARLFPFTPQYLQPGTLRGRERIVTTQSGTHGWRTCAGDVRVFRYDAMGRERERGADWRVKRREGGAYVRVRLQAGEAAIVECGAAPAGEARNAAARERPDVARPAH